MLDLDQVAARNVRAERSRHGWTQSDLARATGWSQDVISNIETGQRRISLSDLPVLCTALEISLTRLLTDAAPADLRAIGLS